MYHNYYSSNKFIIYYLSINVHSFNQEYLIFFLLITIRSLDIFLSLQTSSDPITDPNFFRYLIISKFLSYRNILKSQISQNLKYHKISKFLRLSQNLKISKISLSQYLKFFEISQYHNITISQYHNIVNFSEYLKISLSQNFQIIVYNMEEKIFRKQRN